MTGTASVPSAAAVAATTAATKPEPARVLEWQAPFRLDVRVTLSVQGRGRSDPTFRIDEAGAVWRTSLTPDGPATIRVKALKAPVPAAVAAGQAASTPVLAQAWGPG